MVLKFFYIATSLYSYFPHNLFCPLPTPCPSTHVSIVTGFRAFRPLKKKKSIPKCILSIIKFGQFNLVNLLGLWSIRTKIIGHFGPCNNFLLTNMVQFNIWSELTKGKKEVRIDWVRIVRGPNCRRIVTTFLYVSMFGRQQRQQPRDVY